MISIAVRSTKDSLCFLYMMFILKSVISLILSTDSGKGSSYANVRVKS